MRSKKFLTDTGNDNVGHNFSRFSGSASGLKTRREQSASDPGVATRSTLGLAEMRLQQHHNRLRDRQVRESISEAFWLGHHFEDMTIGVAEVNSSSTAKDVSSLLVEIFWIVSV